MASNLPMKPVRQVALFMFSSLARWVGRSRCRKHVGRLETERKKIEIRKKWAPINVELRIQHNEPALKYSGTVQRNQESSPDTFEFDGAIDEKTYPVKESNSTGRTIKFKRQSPRSVESWSSDSAMEEYAVTTVSGDTLIRKVRVKQKDGKVRDWTEVYDKQS